MNSPADLRTVDVADVYKGDVRAGALMRSGDEVRFRYADDYLLGSDAPALAWSIPIDGRDIISSAGSVPPFFAGLLPEGVRLSGVVAGMKTSEDDHFTILLGGRIGHYRRREGGTGRRRAPGVQRKVSAEMFSSPVSTMHGAAILKLAPPQRFPLLVENENYFMSVAETCGLAGPPRQVIADARGVSGLLVRRFDRDAGHRLAQEDARQLDELYPSSKYRIKTETVLDSLRLVNERCDDLIERR